MKTRKKGKNPLTMCAGSELFYFEFSSLQSCRWCKSGGEQKKNTQTSCHFFPLHTTARENGKIKIKNKLCIWFPVSVSIDLRLEWTIWYSIYQRQFPGTDREVLKKCCGGETIPLHLVHFKCTFKLQTRFDASDSHGRRTNVQRQTSASLKLFEWYKCQVETAVASSRISTKEK